MRRAMRDACAAWCERVVAKGRAQVDAQPGEEAQRRSPGEEARPRLRVGVAQQRGMQRGGRGGGGVHARGVSLVQQVRVRVRGRVGVRGRARVRGRVYLVQQVVARPLRQLGVRRAHALLDLLLDLRGAGGFVNTAAAAAGWWGGYGRVQAGASGCDGCGRVRVRCGAHLWT